MLNLEERPVAVKPAASTVCYTVTLQRSLIIAVHLSMVLRSKHWLLLLNTVSSYVSQPRCIADFDKIIYIRTTFD